MAYPACAGVLEFYRAGVAVDPPLLQTLDRCEAMTLLPRLGK